MLMGFKKKSKFDINLPIDRRTFIKEIGAISLLPLFPACSLVNKLPQITETHNFLHTSPINRTMGDHSELPFSGDDFVRPHQILWDNSTYINKIGGLPKPKRKEELVIIGGGMGGLMSAYQLRSKKPVILEQAPRFGGNAKGEAWNGLTYAIGSAYFVKPEQDSEFYKVLSDIGITKDWTIKRDSKEHVVLNGKLLENFWTGKSEPEYRPVYKKLYEYIMSFVNEGGNVYPDYPTDDPDLRKYLNKLDEEDFKSHLEWVIGASLSPHLTTLVEHFCFSSLGGSSKEISAAAGLNFFAADFGDIAIYPSGNAYIAEALLKQLHRFLPENHLLSNCLVFNVQTQPDGILVSYVDASNEVHSILTEKVIMACPKFVAA
jgi:phytoene dehydrogenase-like protein